jgi:hypothetical protein
VKFSIFLIILTFGVFKFQLLNAQEHVNSWFRTTVRIPIKNKLLIDNEFQLRRQNGFENRNPMDKPLVHSFRLWIHYQFGKSSKVLISPFAYFSTHPLIINAVDENALTRGEKRFALAHLFTPSINSKWALIFRNGLEYRVFSDYNLLRFRTRYGFSYKSTEKIKFLFYGEYFLHLPNSIQNNISDQFRGVGLLEYKFTKSIKFEFGYMFAHRKSTLSSLKWDEHNVMVYFTYFFLQHFKLTNY